MASQKRSSHFYRYAGQSGTQCYMDQLLNIAGKIACSLLLIGVGIGFFWCYFSSKPTLIIPAIVIMLLAAAFLCLKVSGKKKELVRRLKGIDGERIVACALSRIGPQGYYVFHDIVFDGFNIDHIVVGPSGLYCIETKTTSKKGEVSYDGEKVVIGGFGTDKPIKQVVAAKKDLLDALHQMTGRRFDAQCVVLYPNRFIKMEGNMKRKGVWVLNQNAFVKWILKSNAQSELHDEDVCLIANRLETMSRDSKEFASS
jgi:hypothetical protein